MYEDFTETLYKAREGAISLDILNSYGSYFECNKVSFVQKPFDVDINEMAMATRYVRRAYDIHFRDIMDTAKALAEADMNKVVIVQEEE